MTKAGKFQQVVARFVGTAGRSTTWEFSAMTSRQLSFLKLDLDEGGQKYELSARAIAASMHGQDMRIATNLEDEKKRIVLLNSKQDDKKSQITKAEKSKSTDDKGKTPDGKKVGEIDAEMERAAPHNGFTTQQFDGKGDCVANLFAT